MEEMNRVFGPNFGTWLRDSCTVSHECILTLWSQNSSSISHRAVILMKLHYESIIRNWRYWSMRNEWRVGIESTYWSGGLQLFPCTLQHCVYTRYPPVTRQLCAAPLHWHYKKNNFEIFIKYYDICFWITSSMLSAFEIFRIFQNYKLSTYVLPLTKNWNNYNYKEIIRFCFCIRKVCRKITILIFLPYRYLIW